jgi:hypothetical protein
MSQTQGDPRERSGSSAEAKAAADSFSAAPLSYPPVFLPQSSEQAVDVSGDWDAQAWAERAAALAGDGDPEDVALAAFAARKLAGATAFSVLESPFALGVRPKPRRGARRVREATSESPESGPFDVESTMMLQLFPSLFMGDAAVAGRNPSELDPPPPAPVPVAPISQSWPEVSLASFGGYLTRLRRARARAAAQAHAVSIALATGSLDSSSLLERNDLTGDEPEAVAALEMLERDPAAPTPSHNRERRRLWRLAAQRERAQSGLPVLPLGCGAPDPVSLSDFAFGVRFQGMVDSPDGRMKRAVLPPCVPPVAVKADFMAHSRTNAEAFDQVIVGTASQSTATSVVRDPHDPAALDAFTASLAQQSMRVAGWVDSVEEVLSRALPERRTGFFAALDMVQTLRSQVAHGEAVAASALARIRRVKDKVARAGLLVSAKVRRARRLREVRALAGQLAEATKAREQLRRAFQTCDTGAVWSAIASIQRAKDALGGALKGSDTAARLQQMVQREATSVAERIRKEAVSIAVRVVVVGVERWDLASVCGAEGAEQAALRERISDFLLRWRPQRQDVSRVKSAWSLSRGGEASDEVAESAVFVQGESADALLDNEGDEWNELLSAAGKPSVPWAHPQLSSLRRAETSLRFGVRPWLTALIALGPSELETMLEGYRQRVDKEVSEALRTEVAESLRSIRMARRTDDDDDGAVEESPTVALDPEGIEFLEDLLRVGGSREKVTAAQLQSLSSREYASLLEDSCTSLLGLLRRALALHHCVEEAIDDAEASASAHELSAAGHKYAKMEGAQAAQARALSASIVAAAADSAERKLARLVRVRAPLHASVQVRLEDVALVWRIGREFSKQARELVVSATGAPLSAGDGRDAGVMIEAIVQQASGRVDGCLPRWTDQVLRALEGDEWMPSPVSRGIQSLVDEAAWGTLPVRVARATEELLEEDRRFPAEVLIVPPPTELPRASSKTTAWLLTSDGPWWSNELWHYRTGASLHVMLKVCQEANRVSEHCPESAPQVARALAALVSEYRSHTCRLVLHAEAVTTGRLKTITTKHLTVALRSLQAIQALMALWERHLASMLSPLLVSSTLSGLKHAESELVDATEGFMSKITSVVRSLVDRAGPSLSTTNWASFSDPLDPVRGAFKLPDELAPPLVPLLKGLKTLAKIVLGLLPEPQAEEVLGRVAVMMSSQLPLHASAVDADDLTAKERRVIAAHLAGILAGLRAFPGCTAGEDDIRSTPGQVAVHSLLRWLERQFGEAGSAAAKACL